ncbi:hypothetical protein [uncultured Methylobacterium sp.]|uniref:hypothetical protein n=1 Tax=uncultured Methylobacterium sp. TaxID=157278 RepID=UPI0035CAD83E
MPKIPTVAVAGLWSVITLAALSVVALEGRQPKGSRTAGVSLATAAVVAPAVTGSVTHTDATGNRYRKRQE